jgi:hypothetical protein
MRISGFKLELRRVRDAAGKRNTTKQATFNGAD